MDNETTMIEANEYTEVLDSELEEASEAFAEAFGGDLDEDGDGKSGESEKSDALEGVEEESEVDSPDESVDDEAELESKDGEPGGGEEEDGDTSDGSPQDGMPDDRIRKLNEENRKARKELKELKEKLEEAEKLKEQVDDAEKRAATTTDEHPNPEEELETLKVQYANLPDPQRIAKDGLINPVTEEPYSFAEAIAVVANLKQDIQFKINEVQQTVVARMTEARDAERLINDNLTPLVKELMNKYPELDEESVDYDSDLAQLLQEKIDANIVLKRGLASEFKAEPKDFLAAFERVMIKNRTIKVNAMDSVDKKVDTVQSNSKGALDNRKNAKKPSPEDALIESFMTAASEADW
ncbi:MAG: hypothetical protein FWD27_00730 [Coriobacteriia bacterium]|nr:hypothetical protein [Coriobacteriia bacterium]